MFGVLMFRRSSQIAPAEELGRNAGNHREQGGVKKTLKETKLTHLHVIRRQTTLHQSRHFHFGQLDRAGETRYEQARDAHYATLWE